MGRAFLSSILKPNVFLKTFTFSPSVENRLQMNLKFTKSLKVISELQQQIYTSAKMKISELRTALWIPPTSIFTWINCACKLMIYSLLYLFSIMNFIEWYLRKAGCVDNMNCWLNYTFLVLDVKGEKSIPPCNLFFFNFKFYWYMVLVNFYYNRLFLSQHMQ